MLTIDLSILTGAWLQGPPYCSALLCANLQIQRLENSVFLSKSLLLQAIGLSFWGGPSHTLLSSLHGMEAKAPLFPRLAVPPTDAGAAVFSGGT